MKSQKTKKCDKSQTRLKLKDERDESVKITGKVLNEVMETFDE